jgi:hypothetical protein
MMDKLSIRFTEDTRKVLSKQLQSDNRKDFIWLFIYVLLTTALYVYSYFKHHDIWEDESLVYCLQFSWACGALISYEIIKIFKKIKFVKIDFDEQPKYESGFLESYQYSAIEEVKKGVPLLAGFFGAINVIIYLVFLILIS